MNRCRITGWKVAAIAVTLGLAPVAWGDVAAINYGWEDGVGTILGSYASAHNLVDPTNVSGAQAGEYGGTPFTCPGPNSGERYLHVAEDPHSGTPQAFLAFIEGLTDDDVVDASFFGYDVTAGASPSLRIWAHYAHSGDVESYAGSASGNSTYTAGTGWDEVGHSWTFDSDGGARDALVIEARIYSTPSTGAYHTDFFIDDLSVTAPDTATITVAPEPTAVSLLALGGLLMLRRRG